MSYLLSTKSLVLDALDTLGLTMEYMANMPALANPKSMAPFSALVIN